MTAVLRDWTFAVLWAFTLTIPWEAAVEELPWVGTLSRTIGLLAVPIAVAAVVMGGRRHRLLDTHLIMLALAAWALASLAWSIVPAVTLQVASTMLQLLVMVLMMWEFGRDGRRLRQLLWAFVLGTLVGCIAIFFEAGSADELTTTYIRLSQGGVNANHAAFLFSLAIPVAWYLSLTSTMVIHRWVAGLYVPAGAVAMLYTGSRGGLLTLFLALSILPLTLRHGGLRVRALALVSLAAMIVVLANFIPEQTFDRIETIPAELTSGDLGGRSAAWQASLGSFASNPLIGVGAGTSEFQIESIVGRPQGAHNTYLSLAVDLGAVGLGLFLLILMSVAGRWPRLQSHKRKLVGVLLITFLVGLVPGHWEYHKATWLILALMLAETSPVGATTTVDRTASGRGRQRSDRKSAVPAMATPRPDG